MTKGAAVKKLVVDAIPSDVIEKFFELAYERGQFWGDFFLVCWGYGLRSSEVRTMKVSDVDADSEKLYLFDAKQIKAHVTKRTDASLRAVWLKEGKKWLIANSNDSATRFYVRMCHDVEALEGVADELNLLDDYLEAKENCFAMNVERAKEQARRTAPAPRVVDLNVFPAAKGILLSRHYRDHYSGLIFPATDLFSNRAKGNGAIPVTRQGAYKALKEIERKIDQADLGIAGALEGIRLGLHSFRKAAVQRALTATGDVQKASMWIGHGNGRGNLAVTQKYLNTSERSVDELNTALTNYYADNYKNLNLNAGDEAEKAIDASP